MFLSCRKICRGWVWTDSGKVDSMGFMYPYFLFPTHFDFLPFIWFEGVPLSKSTSSPWSWMGLSLQSLSALAVLCRSPGDILKFRAIHLTLLIAESMSDLVASETSACKCLRCLCHSDSNLYITLRDCCIIMHSLIQLSTVTLFT